MNVNMANKNRMFALKPININDVPKEVRENIERQFKNTDEESASLELSGVGKKLSIETSRKERPVLETKPVEARHVLTIMPRTGYAAIDNSLMDSLKNVSDNVKQSAYSIIRQDILRGYIKRIFRRYVRNRTSGQNIVWIGRGSVSGRQLYGR